MDVEIVKKDGSSYRLSDYGVVYDFVVNSITIEGYAEKMEGRSGQIDYGADYGVRRITIPMKFKHYDMHDYAHLRDVIYEILTDTDSYYIREMRRPKRLEYEFIDFGQVPRYKAQTRNRYVGGKQYLVRLVSEITPEQIYDGGEIEIEFETTELPFAETIYTTMDIDSDGLSDIAEKYGLSDNINTDFTAYNHTSTSFTIWNGSNVTINPEEVPLIISFDNVSTSGGAEVKNVTTNEEFIYNGELSGENIIIDGVQVTNGYVNRLRETNREFISLAPGKNEIELKNVSFDELSFDFKFYYK